MAVFGLEPLHYRKVAKDCHISVENNYYSVPSKLERKNALVIYSSDHGFSLGENGFFGNASKDALAKKEQTDIAMFIWLSGYFIEKNPGILEKVKKIVKILFRKIIFSIRF